MTFDVERFTRRRDAIEQLQDFMDGRRSFDITTRSGLEFSLRHDEGRLAVKSADGWNLLEALPDSVLDAFAEQAAGRLESDAAFDVREVTGIALGDSRVEKPGFPGAVCVGEAQPEDNDPDRYVDPSKNPFIPGGTAAERKKKNDAEEVDPLLDPGKNPFIKFG